MGFVLTDTVLNLISTFYYNYLTDMFFTFSKYNLKQMEALKNVLSWISKAGALSFTHCSYSYVLMY